MFEFILFAILGLAAFTATNKQVLMIVFVVMMVLWLFAGFSGWHPPVQFPR